MSKRIIIHIVFSVPPSKLKLLDHILNYLEKKDVWVVKQYGEETY